MIRSIKVEYIRDGLIEELHEGVLQHGFSVDENPDLFYIRSCAKPLQASLLIDYNINLTPKELALCSASHAGEDCHIETAREILNKLEIDESLLKCGVHESLSKTMQKKMLLNGEKASAIHNNCSGKHIGFLTICKKMGWDMETYYKPTHKLQIEVKKKIYELCEINKNYPDTTDGCGVPIVSMPLGNLVKGYSNLVKYYPQLINAITENPYIFGGEDRLDTEIIQNTDNLVAKVGASGLCVVYNIKDYDGFAVKINSASVPARKIAVLEIINRLGWGNVEYDRTIKTLNGKIVGEIKVSF